MSEMINCGQRYIQATGRIAIKDIMNSHGIGVGDVVEVYLKKVNQPTD